MSSNTTQLDFETIGRFGNETGLLEDIETLEQTASTNDYAIQQTRLGVLRCPALVVTKQQTAGRGQRGNAWWSSHASLTFTWCVDSVMPSFPVSLLAAVSVADALEQQVHELASQLSIKWPNDILIRNQKVAGILVETVSKANQSNPTHIVGIGINVNQLELASELENLNPPVSSLRRETVAQTAIPMNDLLKTLIQCLDRNIRNPELDVASSLAKLNQKLSYRNEKIQVSRTNNDILTGYPIAVTSDGGLMISPSNDASDYQIVHSGTIRRVTDATDCE